MDTTITEWAKLITMGVAMPLVVIWVLTWMLKTYIPSIHKDCQESLQAAGKLYLDQAQQARGDFLAALKEQNQQFGVRQEMLAKLHKEGQERMADSVQILANAVKANSDVVVAAFMEEKVVDQPPEHERRRATRTVAKDRQGS